MIRRALNLVSISLAIVAGILLLVTMALTVADVSRRQLGIGGIRGSIEYTELLLVGVFFLAIAFTQRQDGHVSVSLAVERMPDHVARFLIAIGLLLVVPLLLWMVWATGEEALKSYRSNEFRMGLSHIPVWPIRAMVSLSIGALLCEIVASAVGRLRRGKRETEVSQAPLPI